MHWWKMWLRISSVSKTVTVWSVYKREKEKWDSKKNLGRRINGKLKHRKEAGKMCQEKETSLSFFLAAEARSHFSLLA